MFLLKNERNHELQPIHLTLFIDNTECGPQISCPYRSAEVAMVQLWLLRSRTTFKTPHQVENQIYTSTICKLLQRIKFISPVRELASIKATCPRWTRTSPATTQHGPNSLVDSTGPPRLQPLLDTATLWPKLKTAPNRFCFSSS